MFFCFSQDKTSAEPETPIDKKNTEKSAGDDKKDEQTEEKMPEIEPSETPKNEQDSENDENGVRQEERKSEDETPTEEENSSGKTDESAESKSQNSEEIQSSSSNEKETEENQSDKKIENAETETEVEKKVEKVEDKPCESSNSHDVYTGEVHDSNINPDERHNYWPINIMFRRKCQNPHIRIQFDRTVILKNETFLLNVDGKNVRLVASPQTIETYDDIKTLLQIVDDISLSNCCVEPISHIS